MITNKLSAIYIDSMGSDLTVVQDARVSFDKTTEYLGAQDKRLINYLAKHEHFTPFEGCELKVQIECPLYIRSQIMRHRTFTYNEVSRRYTSEDIEFYLPTSLRNQSSDSKQCSDGKHILSDHLIADMYETIDITLDMYEELIEEGVAREQARAILPQCTMTKFRMKGNLRNWHHFLQLRLDSHAQQEVQEIAQQIEAIILDKFPISYKALKGEK